GERAGAGARGRTRLGLRPRRLRPVRPRPLRGAGVALRSPLPLAGARVGWWGPAVGVERARLVGDGPPRSLRLEGELDRARDLRRSQGPGTVAAAAARVRGRRARRA